MSWIITQSWITDEAFGMPTEVEVIGPRAISDADVALLKKGEGQSFRMYDDDGVLYYEGATLDGIDGEDAFGPLDNYGEPNAGCTEIKYYTHDKEWVTL